MPENGPDTSSTLPRPVLTGWRKVALKVTLIVFVAAVVLRLLLFAVVHFGGHGSHTAQSTLTPAAAPMPTWPLKVGDIFTVKPGDPVIARWAESPDNDGFVVQLVEQNGKPITGSQGTGSASLCALEPDYMADAAQAGGTLTLVAQDGTGDWRVHWHGGDTLPPDTNTESANVNCGKDAVVMMSLVQLHGWLNMQAGVAAPPAPAQ